METWARLCLLINLAASLYMTGVIWFVQVVHYPLFAQIGRDAFASYEQRHTALTTWVVAPPMLIEAATAIALLWFRPQGISHLQVGLGVALVAIAWASTFLLQVPCHESLSAGFDATIHARLVATNWIRTIAWSLRGALVLWMTWSLLAEK